jgi:N-acyl-D-aspartate/D-glutamate deacylase
MDIDLLITGGTVIDGTGGPPFAADVAIKDGRILDIGNVPAPESVPRLDARGLYVTPGFVDVHSHSDFTLFIDPRAVSSVTQGVTTELVGNCGHGCAPIGDPALARSNIYGCLTGYDIPWRSMGDYLDRLAAARPAVNVASLVANGNLRLATAGLVDRPSTPDELRQMKKLLEQSLAEGAFGYSTGLEYGPENACSEEEVIELCRITARQGGLYATHTRNRDGEAAETIAEAIRACAASGARLQISHISSVARLADSGRWAVEQALEQVEQAWDRGLDVGFDMHTRSFGTTNLSAALPPWAVQGDRAAIAARLRDPAFRRELQGYRSILTSLARGDWSRIVLFDSRAQPELSRRSIADICAERGFEPLDTICDILLGERDDLHGLMVIAFAYREEDIRCAYEHPGCAIGSDATALAPDGPLGGVSFHGAYTWAAWFFRHFVRETGRLRPEEAIRRITSLPASRLGLGGRGVLCPGAWADVAVFDPTVFAERGTTFEPNQTAVGMNYVLVNGVVAVTDGALTGRCGGAVLRPR